MGLFSGAGKPQAATEHKQAIGDLMVVATPMREGAQYRLAGRIEKTEGDTVLVRRFIRADLFSSEEDVTQTTFRKARQIIDQHGASLFSDGAVDRMV